MFNIMELIKILANINKDVDMFHKTMEIYHQEKATLLRLKIKEILNLQYQIGELGDGLIALRELRDKKVLLRKRQQAKDDNNLYVFITINPKPGVSLEQLMKKTEKLVNRKCFEPSGYWVYEQRGHSPQTMGNGYHAHILLQRKVAYSTYHIRKNIQNTCKDLVGQIKTNELLNIQFIGDEYFIDKKDYILGIKTEDSKDGIKKSLKQNYDKEWRTLMKLENYYQLGKYPHLI